MEDWKTFLNEIYFNPRHPGAYAGPTKLKLILKKNNFHVSIKSIKEWLLDQDAYSLLRQVKYKFKRPRIITTGIDDLWDADLADVSNISQHNDNIRFWLVVIDVFSRKTWVIPVLSKHHTHMVQALQQLFENTERRPKHLRTDKGTEFTNRAVKKLFMDVSVHHYTTRNETKANYAERVIRTLKGLMYRYFLDRQTYRYTDVLADLVSNYNQRPHRSLKGLAPNEITKGNEARIWKKMYVDSINMHKRKQRRYRYKIGDQVRISHLKYTFQRDYQQKWTEEIFRVRRRLHKQGFNLYELKDLMDELIDGYFYEQELQRVPKNVDSAVFRVEKVIRNRQRQGQREILVKWMGWPTKFNSWVKQADVQRY